MSSRVLVLIGIITWVIIGVPSLRFEIRSDHLATPAGLLWAFCFVGFIVCFWIATRPACVGAPEWMMRVGQAVFALICIAIQPNGFQAVLLVIVAGQLAQLSVAGMLAWIAAQTAIMGMILHRNDTQLGFFIALAYFAFQLFGAFTARIAHEEGVARRELAAAHAELQVATGLLEISSRSEERLRIARDLHDLIGHHLTALTLNLEVASHLTGGAAREHVEKSKSLAKLLLSDVRDVVSRLRENEPVDLARALRSMPSVIPTPALQLEIDGDLAVNDQEVARTALRAVQEIVTNAVRHAAARNLRLHVAINDSSLAIDARDDGIGTDYIRCGSGLTGMRERIESLGGTLDLSSMRGHGFEVRVRLPMTEATT